MPNRRVLISPKAQAIQAERQDEAQAVKTLEGLRARPDGGKEETARFLAGAIQRALDSGIAPPTWVRSQISLSQPHSALVPALVALLKTGDPFAAATLGDDLGPVAAGAVPTLREALTHDSEHMRAYAAGALGSIGRAAEPALGDLLKSAKDPEEWVRSNALGAIRKIGPTVDCLPVLIEALQDASPVVREHSALALSRLGTSARDAVPGLKKLAAGGDARVFVAAKAALAAIEHS